MYLCIYKACRKGLLLLHALACLSLGYNLNAQPNVTRVEYYIDTDPGRGGATAISITPGQQLDNLSIQLNPANLSSGVHRLAVRALDANGKWSLDNRWLFYKPYPASGGGSLPPAANLSYAEWYMDTDPGYGQGTAVAVSGTDASNLLININPANISSGVHRLGFRAKDANGSWSLDNRWLFYKPYPTPGGGTLPPAANITYAEWYMDTDPGYGHGTPVSVSGTDASNLLININPANISSGVHRFAFRAKDANGNWSLDNRWLFYKPYPTPGGGTLPPAPNLTYAEWYMDTDPGYGNGTSVPVSGTDVSNLLININPANISSGVHRFAFRAKDANGNWSLDNRWLFYKPYPTPGGGTLPPAPALSYMEYFIDTDPGYGLGKPVALPAGTDVSNLAVPVPLTGVTSGNHKLFIRAKDANGNWSLTNRFDFSVPPAFNQTLTITSAIAQTQCSGGSITVNFTATGTYTNPNQFQLQLSDIHGSFAAPTVIGTLNSVTSGTINGTIPNTITGGSGYRVRVVSNNPALISADNGQDLTIGQPPVVNCPGNITTNAEAGLCGAHVTFAATGTGTITYSPIQPGGVFPVGTTTITATATGTCGVSTCQFTVTVVDNIKPVANCKGITVTLNQNGTATIQASDIDNGSTDNCGIASMSVNPSSFSNANIGNNTVTLTVTDNSGNVSTCTSTVVVNPAPNLKASVNTTNTTCGQANGTASVTVQGGTLPYTYSWNNGATTSGLTGLAAGTYTVTVTDANHLTTTASGVVGGSTAPATPVITLTGNTNLCGDQTVTLTSSAADSYSWSTGATSQSIQVSTSGTYTVTTFTNGCSASASKNVTVNHVTTPPAITAPAAISVNTDAGHCYATVTNLGTAVVTGGCFSGSTPSPTNNAPANNQYGVGTTTVTWSVTDGNGNTATATQTITVTDNQAPIFTAPANRNVPLGSTCSVTIPDLITGLTGSDVCGVVSFTQAPAANTIVSSSNNATITVTITAKDVNGLTTSHDVTLTAKDQSNPTITAPANLTVNADAGKCTASGVSLGTPVTADNCTVANVTNNAPAAFSKGVTVVTWTVTDGAGNTATATQQVTVADNQPPAFTAPANQNVALGNSCTITIPNLISGLTGTDNCSVVGFTQSPLAGTQVSASNNGTVNVVITATDGSGNTTQHTVVLTAKDQTNPTITAPADVSVNTTTGQCTATGVSLGTPVTGDNCSVFSVTSNAPATFNKGVTTVTWTVTDGAGNTATATQKVTVSDKQAPTVLTRNISVTLDNTGNVTITPAQVNNGSFDNCTPAASLIFSLSKSAFTTADLGDNTVTLTVTDADGNAASNTAIVSVKAANKPTITAPASINVNTDPGQCYATVTNLGTPVTTNANGQSPTNNAPSNNHYPVGITTITWTISDGLGNTATATQTVTVTDNQAPVFTAPANRTVALGNNCSITVPDLITGLTGTDNCSVVTFTQSPAANTSVSSSNNGTITATITAKDGNGNTTSHDVVLTAKDQTNPVIAAPANVVVNTDAGLCTASNVTLGAATASDNCAGVVITNNAPPVFAKGVTTVTWTATDAAGNTATATQTVTVNDKQAPTVITQNITVTLDNNGNASITAAQINNGSHDNCTSSGALTMTLSKSAFTSADLGDNTVTLTVTDQDGNSASSNATVTVKSGTKLTITAPAAINANADAGHCYATIGSLGTPIVTGSTLTPTNNAPSGGIFPVGTTTVTWTISDGLGNSATATQIIIVADNQAPQAITKNITRSLDASGNLTITAADVNNGSSDNCGIASMTLDKASFNCNNVGDNTVTLTVTDIHGNTNTATAVVTISKIATQAAVSVTGGSGQYSDPITLQATLTPGSLSGSCTPATTVTFMIGSQVMGTAPLTLSGSGWIATLNTALLETSGNAGSMAPGNKTVTAVFNNVDPKFTIANPTAVLTVLPEDARVYYTGELSGFTTGATQSGATITLSATVKDITAVSADPSYDAYAGDIRNARVKFVNRDDGTDISGWLTPGQVTTPDTKTGTVTFNWNVDIGNLYSKTFNIGIVVDNGYYIRNSAADNAAVIISKPLTGSISGNTVFSHKYSSGIKAADVNTTSPVVFAVKYNSTMTALTGSFTVTIKRYETDGIQHVYQVQNIATGLTSMALNGQIGPSHPYPTAILDAVVSVRDVTTGTPVTIDPAAVMQVTMTDKSTTGAGDAIGITVWNQGGGLWYSSNWDGTRTQEQALYSGNLTVTVPITTSTVVSANADNSADLGSGKLSVSVHPNPAAYHFTLVMQSSNRKPVDVIVYDVLGRIVEARQSVPSNGSLQIGDRYRPGSYFVKVIQGTDHVELKLIKQSD